MRRMALGILLAALAGYFWGFVYWGANPLPYTAWRQAADDVAAGEALRLHFPEAGTYYVPALDRERTPELFEAGPVAVVHMLSIEGRPQADPGIMIRGFALVLVSCGLLAGILRHAALPTYRQRAQLALWIGVAAAVVVDLGGAVWWQLSWEWQLYQAFYDATAFAVPGLVLAHFAGPREPPAEG
ncbi:MAG: hypothetical protein MJE66_23030 [Proteobacteria bacterium]|nr:hypothetical protein [Pseudomonadota bacterium]